MISLTPTPVSSLLDAELNVLFIFLFDFFFSMFYSWLIRIFLSLYCIKNYVYFIILIYSPAEIYWITKKKPKHSIKFNHYWIIIPFIRLLPSVYSCEMKLNPVCPLIYCFDRCFYYFFAGIAALSFRIVCSSQWMYSTLLGMLEHPLSISMSRFLFLRRLSLNFMAQVFALLLLV